MVAQPIDLRLQPSDLLLRCAAEPFVCLLDGGSATSWFSGRALLGFRPRATLQVSATGVAIVRTNAAKERWQGDPLALLQRFADEYRPAAAATRFGSGVVVALSYELRRWIEHLPARVPDPLALPVLHAASYDWLLDYSYADGHYTLAASAAEWSEIARHLHALAATPAPASKPRRRSEPVADLTCAQYTAAVRAALAYIAAGDVYQVNLAQRFVVAEPPPAPALFRALQHHPMPFAAYLDCGDFALLSNSPECFLTLSGAEITTYPVKGTRPRGPDVSGDAALAHQLAGSAKERAEHVMIVDLERNDLGRVCRTGSVRVEELAGVYAFPSLYHLVSTVRGSLRPGVGLAEVLHATFPGGSITGAPKIRAMEIIDELEPVARGFYTGALGYIAPDGNAVFSLLIRTAIATPAAVTYHAGGGIVADSVVMHEYEETLLKAQPFLTALAAV